MNSVLDILLVAWPRLALSAVLIILMVTSRSLCTRFELRKHEWTLKGFAATATIALWVSASAANIVVLTVLTLGLALLALAAHWVASLLILVLGLLAYNVVTSVPGGVLSLILAIQLVACAVLVARAIMTVRRLAAAQRMTPDSSRAETVAMSGLVMGSAEHRLPGEERFVAWWCFRCTGAQKRMPVNVAIVSDDGRFLIDPSSAKLEDFDQLKGERSVQLNGKRARELAAQLNVKSKKKIVGGNLRWLVEGDPISVVGKPEWVSDSAAAGSYRGFNRVPLFRQKGTKFYCVPLPSILRRNRALSVIASAAAVLMGLVVAAIIVKPRVPSLFDSIDQSTMVKISAGPFYMGADKSSIPPAETSYDKLIRQKSRSGWDDASPTHAVKLDVFFIDRLEVTVADYRRCVEAEWPIVPYGLKKFCKEPEPRSQCNYHVKGGDGLPIDCLSWWDAQQYCEWAGKRLPTEAEWEKAARGSDRRIHPWGNEAPTCRHVQSHRCFHEKPIGEFGQELPVGSKPLGVSPFGVLDMAGNVYEWTADWYDPDYYARSPKDNPQGPELDDGDHRTAVPTKRVFRGFWVSSKRGNAKPSHRRAGVRCVADGF